MSLQFLYKGLTHLHNAAMAPQSHHLSLLEDYEGDFYIGQGRTVQYFSANTWRKAFFLFLHCINSTPTVNDFQCTLCCRHPKCLIVDGTSITINKNYFTGTSITRTIGSALQVQREHTRNQRSFFSLENSRTRLQEELKMFAEALTKQHAARNLPVLGQYDNLARSGHVGLMPFLEWIYENVTNESLDDKKAKDLAAFLGRNLATDSPVVAYMPLRAAEAIQTDLQSHGGLLQAETMEVIVERAPIVFKVLLAAGARRSCGFNLPEPFKLLLAEICTLAALCVDGPGIDSVPLLAEDDARRLHASVSSSDCITTGICSGLPQLRHRPRFESDNPQSQGRRDEDRVCHKNFIAGGARTGGVMTVFCEHGVCYASFILANAESRDHLFSFMIKFLERPPEVLVYDFGCAVLDYCLNRLPGWFKDMLVVVDKFHWDNHKSCCSSFNMREYQDVGMINSQIAEQCNAALRRINPTLHKSSQPFFMAILRQYLRGWNKRKNERLEEALARQRRYGPQRLSNNAGG